jgi:ribosomal protein L7/L12
MFHFLFGQASEDASRLRRVERKLDLILKHLGIKYAEPAPGEGLTGQVRALADRGEKIAAIKAHRDQTGAGLAEAKRAVEVYMAGRR